MHRLSSYGLLTTRLALCVVCAVWAALAMLATPANAQTRVTAAQVADAIRNSPNASTWLRTNADAVGSLAMFESGGRLDVYNGSCCTGVLQMNRDNIRVYARVSREVFATWTLQQQVNAWAALTTDALKARAPASLIAMGTFDGRTVDGNLVLACVQLGIGNCQRMINSGSCSGFADINGTTICAMADRIAGSTGTGTGTGTGSGGSTGGAATGGATSNPLQCVRGADGQCMSMNEAIEYGFEQGSGVSMSRIRSIIFLLMVAVTLLVVGSAMVGVFNQFSKGVISKAEMIHYMRRGFIIVGIVFVVMSMF